MAAPCALIASCCDTPPTELIKQILDKEELPESTHLLEEIHSYPWHIDTKYYTADINLCISYKKTIGNEEFSESVQALVLQFDSKQESSFELVKSWLPFVEQLEPNVQILVCERCTQNDVISRGKVFEWCLDNNFELVELNPEELSDNEEEDEFKETVGVKRIIQALHAHTWSNLTMKETPSFHSQYFQELKAEEAANLSSQSVNTAEQQLSNLSLDNGVHTEDLKQKVETKTTDKDKSCNQASKGGSSHKKDGHESKDQESGAKIDSMFSDDDKALFKALGNEEEDEESFEVLFSRMREMKEKAERLPPEERKAYAEKVAISFWKAIGGDEDEIDGLVDSD